jgi:hypothetical protein
VRPSESYFAMFHSYFIEPGKDVSSVSFNVYSPDKSKRCPNTTLGSLARILWLV